MSNNLDLSEILNVVDNEDAIIEWLENEGNYTFGGSNAVSLAEIENFIGIMATAHDENVITAEEFRKIDILIGAAQEEGIEFVDLES